MGVGKNVIRDPMNKRDSGVRQKDLITIAFESYTKKYVLFLPLRDFITVVTCDFKRMRDALVVKEEVQTAKYRCQMPNTNQNIWI